MRVLYFFLGALVLTITAANSSKNDENQTITRSDFTEDYTIHSLPLPESVELAGEGVPLDDYEVAERLDRELLVNTYWQSNTLLMIKRGAKWIPTFTQIFQEEGVPTDLVYLGLIESGYQNVVSPAGAAGFWQFLESTGEEYGLVINGEVDERYHPEKSARAAAQYLKESKEEFGSWTLAAASYNMGRAGLGRQLERQGTTNYYDLLLNSETARYVFRILAVKTILSDPEAYGFLVHEEDHYTRPETYTVELSTPVESFPGFAAEHGISYKTLKYFNPWLREAFLKNREGRTYEIILPKAAQNSEED